jgi:hypothetical protein
MNKLLTPILAVILAGCGGKEQDSKKQESAAQVQLSQEELRIISEEWRKDSLACLRLRDAKKIKQLISQLALVGKDSTVLLEDLGKPNFSYRVSDDPNRKVFCLCA